MENIKVVGIIPARYGSSRCPGKPLIPINGKLMIQRVYEQCSRSTLLQSVCVATDDTRIAEAVESFGGKVVMTRADHPSGTDRVAEAAEKLNADIVVNIQGDQPFVDVSMIDEAVKPMIEADAPDVSTLMFPMKDEKILSDYSVVKVVVTLAGNALYFSRARIPYPRENIEHTVYEHVGIYVYRKDTLIKLTQLPASMLEKVESLEQLRWLEHGLRIRVTESTVSDTFFHGFSIDTKEDFERAEQMLRERGL